MHRNKFLFNKTNRRTNFPNLFCQETLHVSGSSSVHHQEFFTVHLALVYVMQVWWQLSSMTSTVENSWRWAEKMPQTCRVSWQNKFGKSERLLVLSKKKWVCDQMHLAGNTRWQQGSKVTPELWILITKLASCHLSEAWNLAMTPKYSGSRLLWSLWDPHFLITITGW